MPAYRVFGSRERERGKKNGDASAGKTFETIHIDHTTTNNNNNNSKKPEEGRERDRLRERGTWKKFSSWIELSTMRKVLVILKSKCTINHWSVDNKQSSLITILFVPLKTNLFQFQFHWANKSAWTRHKSENETATVSGVEWERRWKFETGINANDISGKV